MKLFLSLAALGCAWGAPIIPSSKIASEIASADRTQSIIKAIIQGSSQDPIWQEIRQAAEQTAENMKVELDWISIESSNPEQAMIKEIQKIAASEIRPDALMVNIASSKIAKAIRAINADPVKPELPIIGVRTGARLMKTAGIKNMVAPDMRQNGVLAAEALKEIIPRLAIEVDPAIEIAPENLPKILIVRSEPDNLSDNVAVVDGIREIIPEGISNLEILNIESLLPEAILAQIREKTIGCEFSGVILSGNIALEPAIEAMSQNECSLESMPLGALDSSPAAYEAIEAGQLSFLVRNQQYLQGSFSSILAMIVGTTGKAPIASAESESGAFLTQPELISLQNLPIQQERILEAQAFPVDRSQILIGSVTHNMRADPYWEPVNIAARQAAEDMGIVLLSAPIEHELQSELDRVRVSDQQLVPFKMSSRMNLLCNSQAVKGMLVSIPNQQVVGAIESCQISSKPLISMNAGEEISSELGLINHIGSNDIEAGKIAGQQLMKNPAISLALCINHASDVSATDKRCEGLEQSLILEGNHIVYMGEVDVPVSDSLEYRRIVEQFVAEYEAAHPELKISPEWSEIGIVAAGAPQHVPLLQLQALHPEADAVAFDVSRILYDAIEAGVKQVGIDLESELQGYLPVSLIAIEAISGQHLSTKVIEGPVKIVDRVPSVIPN